MKFLRQNFFRNFRTSVAFSVGILTFVFSGCAGDGDDGSSAPPAYSLMLRKGAHYDLESPNARAGFDAASNSWWLVGNGVTVQLSPLNAGKPKTAKTADPKDNSAAPAPAGAVILHLRTTADPHVKSEISLLRVVTPDFRIDAPARTPGAIHVSRIDSPNNVQTFRDSNYIRVSRAGNRVKAVLSAKFLRHYAPHGAAVTWFDTSPAALPSQALAPADTPATTIP